jgi:hypothetical protein
VPCRRPLAHAVDAGAALDDEPRDLIDDFDAFKKALQSLAYRLVNAAQEP